MLEMCIHSDNFLFKIRRTSLLIFIFITNIYLLHSENNLMLTKYLVLKYALTKDSICFLDETTNLSSDEQMQSSALQKAVHLRISTNNVPNVRRCMMGHYI